jgi:hypothetical protein
MQSAGQNTPGFHLIFIAAFFFLRLMVEPVLLRKADPNRNRLKASLCYAARPNSLLMNRAWATISPLITHRALPFLIILTASIPRNVRYAVQNEPYPLASHTLCFTVL